MGDAHKSRINIAAVPLPRADTWLWIKQFPCCARFVVLATGLIDIVYRTIVFGSRFVQRRSLGVGGQNAGVIGDVEVASRG